MSEKYLGEVSTPLLINQIKENCAQKRTTLPLASIDELGHIYQYMGATSGSLVHGYFYECVSDGQDPATYFWSQVNTQPTPATPTASGTTFDNTTSGLQATNVQGAIDEVESRVDNIEEKIPSTATSSNKLIDHDSLGTAAFKDSTDRVSPNNTALVESQSVYSAINTALSSIYTPRGDITCAELTSDLLIAANVGNIYETSDSGTTTALFLQGAGVPIATGSNVGIISAGQGRILFNLMANAFDLTSYQKKDLTSAVEGATTVEGALGALSTNKQAKTLSTSVESQTTVEGALGALSTNKQAKTLTTSVESETTVEGALGALSTNKATQTSLNTEIRARAELGAHNWINLDDSLLRGKEGEDTSYTFLPTGIEIANATSDTYRVCSWWIKNLKPNTDYILSSDVTNVSGTGRMFIRDSDSSTFLCDTQNISTSKNISLSFNTGAYTSLYIAIYSATNTAAIGDIKYENLLLRLADDASTVYGDFSKPNIELTKDVKGLLDNVTFMGAKNFFNYDAWNGVTVTRGTAVFENNGVTLTAMGDDAHTNFTSASGYSSNANIPVQQGVPIALTWDLPSGDPVGDVFIFPNGTTTGLITAKNYTKRLVYTPTSGVSYVTVRFGVSTSGNTCHYKNIQVTLASNTDNTYAPYTMTNKQITEIVPSNASASNKLVTESETIRRYDLTASANTFAAVKTALETFYTSSTATMRTPYCGYITASGAVWWYEFEKVDANYGYGELRYYDVDNTWYTFRVGTGVFTYQPVLNAELLSASNTFTPSSDYEILDWNVNQLGNHVWGTFILHKTSGDIPAGQTEVGNFSSTLRNAVNSVCFCSNNRYGGGAFYTGYLFIDQTGKTLMGNPSGTTAGINHAKISIDFCLA